MTKEFDPTRPCRYRCGEKPLAVFALPEPQEDGETIVSVRRSLRAHTHFPGGRLALDARSGLDLINISEEVREKVAKEVKLEWEQCPSCSKLEQLVFSGRMVVAYAQENGFWCSVRPFIELSGIENTAEEARATVEQAVRKALGWPE